jgi:hypothetical protein
MDRQKQEILMESLNEGMTSSIKKALGKGKETFDKIRDGIKRESTETKEVIKLLRKANSGTILTMKEKEFIKAQALDLVKALPLIAIQGIPAPIPITPFLILLSKKVGFNILPDSHIKTDYKINEEKGKTLFHPGSGDAVQGTGYADKAAADRTIKIIDKLKKTDHRHAMSIATTMENRAKTHKHQTPDMKEAAKIFRAWIDKNKKG